VPESAEEVVTLLRAWGQGDQGALDRLVPLVYAELRRLARGYMSRERPEHTLQTTALINEVFLRLLGADLPWKDRAHFLGIAARLMRRILVDHARSRGFQKRGGAIRHIEIEEGLAVPPSVDLDLLALDRALEKLKTIDERKAQVVELRFFGGLTVDETAEALGISSDTVKRDWALAKLWLRRELGGETLE